MLARHKQLEVIAYAVDDAAQENKEYIIGAEFAVSKDVQDLNTLACMSNLAC